MFCTDINRQSKYAIVGSFDYSITLIKIEDKKKLTFVQKLESHKDVIYSLKFSPDGESFFSSSADRTIIYWRKSKIGSLIDGFEKHQVFAEATGTIFTIDIIGRGDMLISGTSDGCVQIWKLDKSDESEKYLLTGSVKIHEDVVYSVRVINNMNMLLSGSSDKTARLWRLLSNISKYRDGRSLSGENKGKISTLEISRNESVVLAGTFVGEVEIWRKSIRTKNFEHFQHSKPHEMKIKSTAISYDAERFMLGSLDSKISFFLLNENIKAYELKAVFTDHLEAIYTLTLSSDSSLLISGSFDKRVVIRKYSESQGEYLHLQTIKGHLGTVFSVEISRDKSMIANCSYDKTIRIWRLNTIKGLYDFDQKLSGHTDFVQALALSYDSKTLVTGSKDKTVKVWREENNEWKLNFQLLVSDSVDEISLDNNFLLISQSSGVLSVFKASGFGFMHWIDVSKGAMGRRSPTLDTLITIDTENQNNLFIRNYGYKRFNFCKDSFLFHAVRDLFKGGEATSIVSEEGIKMLIDYFRERIKEKNDESNYDQQDILQIIHSRINLVYLVVLSKSVELLSEILDLFGYYQFFYQDGFDPVITAIDYELSSILDHFADYFYQNPERIYLNERFIIKGLKCCSSKFKLFIANSMFKEGAHPTMMLQIPEHILSSTHEYCKVLSCRSFNDEDNKRKLNKIFNQKGSRYYQIRIRYLHSVCPIDFSFTSEFTTDLLEALSTADESILMTDLEYLIKALWSRQKIYIFAYSILAWIHTFLLYLGIIWYNGNDRTLTITISYYITCFLLVFYEVIVFCRSGIGYLRSLYNMTDLIIYLGGFIIMNIANESMGLHDTEPVYNLVTSCILFIAGARLLTHLKVIDGVRYLISMIMWVFMDIFYFLIILATSVIIFASLSLHISKPSQLSSSAPSPFLYSVTSTYLLGFSSFGESSSGSSAWPSPGDLPASLFFLFESIFLPLIMFNLLIALISSTFEKFRENERVVNCEGLVAMMREWNSVCRGWAAPSTRPQLLLQLVRGSRSAERLNRAALLRKEEI